MDFRRHADAVVTLYISEVQRDQSYQIQAGLEVLWTVLTTSSEAWYEIESRPLTPLAPYENNFVRTTNMYY